MKPATPLLKTFSLAALLVAGTAAQAALLSYTQLTDPGNTTAWTGTTALTNSGPAAIGDLSTLLAGSAGTPGGNVEIGRLGSAASITGVSNGHQFVFSSLGYTDWFTGITETALTTNYILASANEAGIASLTSSQLTNAIATFRTSNAWALVSDPNLSYVDYTGTTLSFGLAGYISAYPTLAVLFPDYAQFVPLTAQVSEVIKVAIDGGAAQYIYGFEATASGVTGPVSTNPLVPTPFTGNFAFALAVPEPASLALVGLGLVGVLASRRRKAARA